MHINGKTSFFSAQADLYPIAGAYLRGENIQYCLRDLNLDFSKTLNPREALEHLRTLFCLALMTENKLSQRISLIKALEGAEQYPLPRYFQLKEASLEAIAVLLKVQRPRRDYEQEESGAVLLDKEGFWPWARGPHLGMHAELGVYLAVTAHLRGDEALSEKVKRLARWQKKRLTYWGALSAGGWLTEEDAGSARAWSELLFQAVSCLLGENYPAALSSTREHGSLFRLIHRWLQDRGESSSSCAEDEASWDSRSALATISTAENHVSAAFSGGGTAMGAWLRKGPSILTAGPCQAPVGDCRAFGILGPESPPQCRELSTSCFYIEGDVSIVGRPLEGEDPALYRGSMPSLAWAKVCQKWQDMRWTIDMEVFSLLPLNRLAFCFYVSGETALVDDTNTLPKASLQRYEGKVGSVVLDGSFRIDAHSNKGTMQVHPLASCDSFWGADFLLSYILDPAHSRYSWTASLA